MLSRARFHHCHFKRRNEMRMKIFMIFIMAAWVACASLAAGAQDAVLTNRVTELRAAPDDGAAVIQSLREKTPVQVLKRQGPWNQAKVGTNTGWVRMMHLRGGSSVVVEQQSASGGFFSSFNRLLLGDRERGQQTKQSATLGIRGFSREDVERAELNPAELEKLKRYQASDVQARQLASQGRLTFRSVAYLAQDAVEAASKQGAKK
jgi:hypothetical protein